MRVVSNNFMDILILTASTRDGWVEKIREAARDELLSSDKLVLLIMYNSKEQAM